MKLARRSVVLLVSATALILAGCSGNVAPAAKPPPLHHDLANNLGAIGILPIEAPVTIAFRLKRGKLGAAGRGAKAAGRSFSSHMMDSGLGGGGIIFTPFVMVGGAVHGIVVGGTGKEFREGGKLLQQVLAEKPIGVALRNQLLTEFSIQTGNPAHLLDDPPAQNRIRGGVQTIVRIEDIIVVFEPEERNAVPVLLPKLSARLLLLRADSNEELYVADMETFIGVRRATFRDWVADDGVLFREVLDETPVEDLVKQALTEMFLEYDSLVPEDSPRIPADVQPFEPDY